MGADPRKGSWTYLADSGTPDSVAAGVLCSWWATAPFAAAAHAHSGWRCWAFRLSASWPLKAFYWTMAFQRFTKTCAISFSFFVWQTFPLARDKIFGSRLFALFTCFAAFCYAVSIFHFEFSFLIYSSHDKWTLEMLTIADRLRVRPSIFNLVHSRETRSKLFTQSAHQLKPGSVSLPGD